LAQNSASFAWMLKKNWRKLALIPAF